MPNPESLPSGTAPNNEPEGKQYKPFASKHQVLLVSGAQPHKRLLDYQVILTIWNNADLFLAEEQAAAVREPQMQATQEQQEVTQSANERLRTKSTTGHKFSEITNANTHGAGHIPPPAQQWNLNPSGDQTALNAILKLRLPSFRIDERANDVPEGNSPVKGLSSAKGKARVSQSFPVDHAEDTTVEGGVDEEESDDPADESFCLETLKGGQSATRRARTRVQVEPKTTSSRKTRFQPPRGKTRATDYSEDTVDNADYTMDSTNNVDDDEEGTSDVDEGRMSTEAHQDSEDPESQNDTDNTTTAGAASIVNAAQPPPAPTSTAGLLQATTAPVQANTVVPNPPANPPANPAVTAPGAPANHLGLDEHFVLGRPSPAGALVPTNRAMTTFRWVPRRGAVDFNSSRSVELLNRWKQQLVRRACRRLGIVRDARATRAH